jgi:hypothetical protein
MKIQDADVKSQISNGKFEICNLQFEMASVARARKREHSFEEVSHVSSRKKH